MNPEKFLKEFQAFEAWHFDLKAKCDRVEPADEVVFLNENIESAKKYFYQKIEGFGNICLTFSEVEKDEIRKVIANSKLVEVLKEAPYFYQSIERPRGYAGDAEMMSIIYRNQFEGKTTYGKLINKIGTECIAGIAIRNRKKLITDEVLDLPFGEILSLAAGPAEELFDFLNKYPNTEHRFKALDHDMQTLIDAKKRNSFSNLEYSIANAYNLIKGDRKILTPTLAVDYKSKENGKPKLETLQDEQFHFVYSIGLFDYIQTFDDPKKGTKALTSELFKLLKPGGLLMIGNVSPMMPIGVIWTMEFICNWKLIYRTREEIIAFCEGIPEPEIKDLEIVMEPAGVNYFIKIRKKSKPDISEFTKNKKKESEQTVTH